MSRQGKRNPNGHKEKIKNWLLKGEEIDRAKAAAMNMGMDLPTRISNLRLDYGMTIKQRPINEKRLNGPYIYWMTQEDIADYKQSTK